MNFILSDTLDSYLVLKESVSCFSEMQVKRATHKRFFFCSWFNLKLFLNSWYKRPEGKQVVLIHFGKRKKKGSRKLCRGSQIGIQWELKRKQIWVKNIAFKNTSSNELSSRSYANFDFLLLLFLICCSLSTGKDHTNHLVSRKIAPFNMHKNKALELLLKCIRRSENFTQILVEFPLQLMVVKILQILFQLLAGTKKNKPQ